MYSRLSNNRTATETNMKLGTATGSMTNYLMSGTKGAPEPVVGMGATKLGWTDRYPYTIVEVVSKNTIVVQEDNASRVDNNGMSESQEYVFTANTEAYKVTLKRGKDGAWRSAGGKKNGSQFAIGYREKYRDFSF